MFRSFFNFFFFFIAAFTLFYNTFCDVSQRAPACQLRLSKMIISCVSLILNYMFYPPVLVSAFLNKNVFFIFSVLFSTDLQTAFGVSVLYGLSLKIKQDEDIVFMQCSDCDVPQYPLSIWGLFTCLKSQYMFFCFSVSEHQDSSGNLPEPGSIRQRFWSSKNVGRGSASISPLSV